MNKSVPADKNRLNLFMVTKIMAVLYIVVCEVIIPSGYANGILRIAVLGVLVLCVLALDSAKLRFDSFYIIEFVFILFTAATSLLVARNFSLSLDPIISLIYEFAFGYCMYKICTKESSIDIFAYAMVLSGLILAVYLIITGGYLSGKISRVSINENMNENTLGVFFVLCIWCTIYLFTKKEIKAIRIIMAITFIAILLYYIIATASRKALIAALVLLGFSILFVLRPYLRRYSFGKRSLVFVLIIGIVGFIAYRYGAVFSSISYSMNTRMQVLASERVTDMHRFELIKDALKVFGEHPVIGVGWNNYRLYSFSGQYSHCTYVEILACTGVFGSVIGYSLWFKTIRSLKNLKKYKVELFNAVSLLIVMLFVCSVQIMYYNTTLLMMLHILYTLCHIYDNRDELQAGNVE